MKKKFVDWSVTVKQEKTGTDLNDPLINELYIKDDLRSVRCKVHFTFPLILNVFNRGRNALLRENWKEQAELILTVVSS